jgi:TolB protein
LWAFAPGEARPIALTEGDFDDRDPAVSPDGRTVAFASNRGTGWDLYLLDLSSGEVRALTTTRGYEGHPTWSPDGQYLAYEVYAGDDLDVWIMKVDGTEVIQLTNAPSLDAAPDWAPGTGRRIAFVSDRDGFPDVFIADLDQPDETRRFRNVTNSPARAEADPAFSPDGDFIAYSGRSNGLDLLYRQDITSEKSGAQSLGPGTVPAWDPSGAALAALLPGPTETHLVVYPLADSVLASLGITAPGSVRSVAWSQHGLPDEAYRRAATEPTEGSPPGSPSTGRMSLKQLADIAAPHPQLSEAVSAEFVGLRQRAGGDAGWDVLGSLENAFVGLNDPLPPGFLYNDWLYTGRAFAVSKAAMQSGWLEVVREDFGVETYWRLFVRASPQDGSRGEPLSVRPWDFSTRASGDPTTYDRGGSLKSSIPSGYFIDLTELAADFGFDRVPAMANWRTYYQAARFNEFARTDGLTWLQAMLEIYPPEAIVTPTAFRTPTLTPTRTPRPTITPWWWWWLLTQQAPTATPVVSTVTVTP